MATSNIATLRPFSLAEQCHTQNFYTLYETLNDTLYDTVAMLYCRGGHWVWRGQHMLQHKSQTNKETPSWAVPHSEFYFANIHGFTRPPTWVPCLLIKFQDSSSSKIEGHCKYFYGNSRVFEGSNREVSRVFPRNFKEVLRVIQESFKDISRKFLGCFKENWRVIQGSFQWYSRIFEKSA